MKIGPTVPTKWPSINMLNASAIFRLLIDDEQPVEPAKEPVDPNQLALDFNQDELLDPMKEIERYTEKPLRIPGDGPTTTFQKFQDELDGGHPRRDEEGHRWKLLTWRGRTRLIDYGDYIVVRYHDTDVVTAHRDGKVVIDTGGWHPGGGRYDPAWRGEPGNTTQDRIARVGGSAGGWRIYKKDHVWYWYNPGLGKGDYSDTVRYPFSSGDTIFPDGSLQAQEPPHDARRRRRR